MNGLTLNIFLFSLYILILTVYSYHFRFLFLFSFDVCTYRYVCVCVCFSGTAGNPCACPSGFTRCAGRCLMTVNKPFFSYDSAASACAKHDALLAVPRSEEENECAKSMTAGLNLGFYLGAKDDVKEGKHVGADGTCGTVPASKDWWGLGQPDNGGTLISNEDCTTIFLGGWNDVVCKGLLATTQALCQLRSCYEPQCSP